MTITPIRPVLGAPEAPTAPDESNSFGALGVPPELVAVLERDGIRIPFPIQVATLPDLLAGRDVCGKAPTGSGKTLAFGLGVLARLPSRQGRQARSGRDKGAPDALILVPTRELAAQVEEVLVPLAACVGAKVTSVYGGVSYGKQRAALRRGVEVLVACPGRLEDLIQQGEVDLSHTSLVVIDEADRMADMGFLPSVRRLVDGTRSDRQTMLFSATLEGPVEKLVRDYQRSPARHDVAGDDDRTGQVHHRFWRADAQDRVRITAEVVAARGPAMVFCRTKRGADRLSERLSRSGIEVAAIHGDRSQAQRERALAAFRAGRVHALVATDVAARGIHVDAVPLVVHYDPPGDATDYVHRSGRTGRAGADGIVVSLISPDATPVARRMQRDLGFEQGVSAPDVPGLPQIIVPVRVTRAAGAGARTADHKAGPRPERSERPPARPQRARGQWAKKPAPGAPARGSRAQPSRSSRQSRGRTATR
jgi:superfamily II DNA/RNA helicase